MAAQWFCKISGKISPPLSPKQLKALASQGKLGPNDLVRQGDAGPWIPAVCVRGLMPGDGSAATLPEATPRPMAETARRGPAKYARKSKPVGTPAPTKSSPVLPVAETTGAPSSESTKPSRVPPAVPKSRPGPRQAAPVGISAVSQSATHRALGRSITTPRKRRRNNLLAVGFLTVALIAVAVAGVVLLTQQQDDSIAKADHAVPAALANQPSQEKPAVKDGVAPKAGGARPAARPEKETRWTDASKARVRCGEVRVQVLSARIGDAPEAGSGEKCLLITLQVENLSANEDHEFVRWSSFGTQADHVTLTDNTGKPYRQRVAGGKTDPLAQSPATGFRRAASRQATLLAAFQATGTALESPAESEAPVLDERRPHAKKVPQRSSGRRPVAELLPAAGKIKDVLVFECPGDGVEKLYLTLPGKAVGWHESINFLIPKAMFRGDDKPAEPDPFAEEPEKGEESEKPETGDSKMPETPKPADQEELDPGEKAFRELNKELQGEDDEEGEDFETMLKPKPKPKPKGAKKRRRSRR